MAWTEITRAQYRRDGLRYASDVSDEEWLLIESLLPRAPALPYRPRRIATEARERVAFRLIGYARVSTYGQTLDARLGQLKAAGCARIYREKATGARPTGKSFGGCSSTWRPATASQLHCHVKACS